MGKRCALTLLGLALAVALLAQQQSRRVMVEHAFQQVLGRPPGPDELRYWLALPSTDPRVKSEQALVRQQQQFLKQFPAARAAVIQRAFAAALHCAPNPAAQGAWDLLIETSGVTYASLVAQLRRLGAAARSQCVLH